MANGKFYLTWYNRYTRWTPAEGGFYLTGRTSDGNNFEEYDVDEVDREMVFSELYTSFMDCIEQFGLSPSDIKKRKHSTYTEWVIEHGEGSDREILVLHINRIDPLFSDYEERDDGLEDEDDWVEEEDLLEDMAPCDYSGICGGPSCSCYAKCHGWVK